MVSVPRVLFYNVVDINKITTAFLEKPPPYINAQLV